MSQRQAQLFKFYVLLIIKMIYTNIEITNFCEKLRNCHLTSKVQIIKDVFKIENAHK